MSCGRCHDSHVFMRSVCPHCNGTEMSDGSKKRHRDGKMGKTK